MLFYIDVNSVSSGEAAPMRSEQMTTQVISLNLLPILIGQIEARGDDQAADRKGGKGGFREMEEEGMEGRPSRTTWPGEATVARVT